MHNGQLLSVSALLVSPSIMVTVISRLGHPQISYFRTESQLTKVETLTIYSVTNWARVGMQKIHMTCF